MTSKYDVIIIGAGPAGSSAAILLAQAGWSVAVLEKQRFPRRKVCGECIAASNLALFDALGIGEAFGELAGPELRWVALMCGEKMICADLPPIKKGPHQWGRALGREYLDSLLLDRAKAAGATVLQPWMAGAVRGGPGAYECEASAVDSSRTETLVAPLLIMASGSWERRISVHKAKRWSRKPGDLFAFKANFHGGRLADGLLPLIAFPGGYGGMVVGNHAAITLACCIRRDTLEACRKEMPGRKAGEVIESYLQAMCSGVSDALVGACREGDWLSVGPIRPGIRIRRHAGDPFCVGNAAGEAHPIIGEGISMAIQSAWLLCGRLMRYRNEISDSGLQQRIHRDYAEAWKRSFTRRIRLAALFAHVAMRPGLLTAGLLPILQYWPAMLTHGARLSGKVRGCRDML